MDWDKLKIFHSVAEASSFTKASTILNLSQSAISRQIQALENDIALGQHDIRIISGSTLPSNKVAEYNMYLDAYKLGLVDDVEVLKKSEIFDKEGVLQRKGRMQQMQQYIATLENQVKELKGDLQTADRETVSARKRTETEKFKSRLTEVIEQGKSKEKDKLLKLNAAIDSMSNEEGQ